MELIKLMQSKDVHTSNFLPTKKELQNSSKAFANKLIFDGEHDLKEAYSQAIRLKESITIVEGIIKDSLPLDNFEAFGIKATYRNGGDTINFKDDEVIQQLEKKIAERKELLKVALKSENSIYDSEGVEVPKVSKTPRKSGLSVSF